MKRFTLASRLINAIVVINGGHRVIIRASGWRIALGRDPSSPGLGDVCLRSANTARGRSTAGRKAVGQGRFGRSKEQGSGWNSFARNFHDDVGFGRASSVFQRSPSDAGRGGRAGWGRGPRRGAETRRALVISGPRYSWSFQTQPTVLRCLGFRTRNV